VSGIDAISNETIREAADRLRGAASAGRPTPPVRDLIGADDVAAAYAVQRELTQERIAGGAVVVGRKIGLTAPAVQAQLGVDQPDFGVLFDDMEFAGGDIVPASTIMQPRVEAEIAFLLKDDLAEGDLDYDQIVAAIDYATPAIEICGSRVENWDISFGDTVADNASAGAFVLGPSRMTLDKFDPRAATMSMRIDGEVVSTGEGSACLGDPILAVQWLARTVRSLGEPLRRGQIVLSGALGPMCSVAPGSTVHASVEPLGAVQFTLSKEDQ
jgi:2-keto-4-pentenoate hydratase